MFVTTLALSCLTCKHVFVVAIILGIVCSLIVVYIFSSTGHVDGEFADRYNCFGYGSNVDGWDQYEC